MPNKKKIDEINEILKTLFEVYTKKINSSIVLGYQEVLQKFDVSVLKKTAREILATHAYRNMPLPAEVLIIASRVESEYNLVKANFAFKKAEKAVHNPGWERSVVFDDPKIHHSIQAMNNWKQFCKEYWMCVDIEHSYKNMRQTFIEFYLNADLEKMIIPLRLIGDSKEAVYVGDKNRSLIWLKDREAKNARIAKVRENTKRLKEISLKQKKKWQDKIEAERSKMNPKVTQLTKDVITKMSEEKKTVIKKQCFMCGFKEKEDYKLIRYINVPLWCCPAHSEVEAERAFKKALSA